jgi:diketogulonate reductase-like aldo/keto reductase
MDVPATTTPQVMLPSAEEWPALGLGTWRMGESAAHAATDLAALRAAFDMGFRVIDTAEMYGAATGSATGASAISISTTCAN